MFSLIARYHGGVCDVVATGELEPEAVVPPSIFVDRCGGHSVSLTKDEMAAMVAVDIPARSFVNLGIGGGHY